MGKIKTFIKKHPTFTACSVFAVVYPVMKLFGLPDIAIRLVAIYSAVLGGLGIYIGYKVAETQPKWFVDAKNWLIKKLNLEEFFSDPDDDLELGLEPGFVPEFDDDVTEKAEFDKFFDKIEEKRAAAAYGDFATVGLTWRQKLNEYIGRMFERYETDNVSIDSYNLAGIVAYSMTTGQETKDQLGVVYEAIKEIMINPCEYTMKKEEFGGFLFGYSLELIEELDCLNVGFRNEAQFKEEVVDVLSMYTAISKNERRMDALIEALRDTSDDYKTF